MSAVTPRGVIQICVHCALDSDQSSLSAHRHLIDLAAELAATMQRFELPATWALSDRNLEALDGVVKSTENFEVALLADASWCQPQISRREVVSELVRRLDLFRNRHFDVSTLVLHNADLGQHVEALKRESIQVVRRQADALAGQIRSSITSPRYGVLMITPSAVLPGRPGFVARWDHAYIAKRSLWKAISQRSTQHVVIDLGKLMRLTVSSRRRVARWLRMVARLRDAGRLQIELVHQAPARRCPSQQGQSSRSILRPAA